MKLGIVGLPNVGKSTLFNAITKAGAEAANYPFCTIEPNVGVVTVPDERVTTLSKVYNSKKTIYTTIEFSDIAGLVKGASKGEGLGNKFLGHIREVEAIVHVVRCFDDENVVHVDGRIDPVNDIEVINTELIIADMEVLERLTPARLEGCLSELNACETVVLDANLRPDAIEWLCGHVERPLMADPVSVAKAGKLLFCPLAGFHNLPAGLLEIGAVAKGGRRGQDSRAVHGIGVKGIFDIRQNLDKARLAYGKAYAKAGQGAGL